MIVAVLRLELQLPGCRSLKEKRAALRPLLEAARQRFGASAAEVGAQDSRQRAALGFALVSGEAAVARRELQRMERALLARSGLRLLSRRLELVRLDAGADVDGAQGGSPYAPGGWARWAAEET